jgi:hypothetical protein
MQISPKPLTVAFITAMAAAFLLVFNIGQGLRAAEAASSLQAVSGVDDFMKNVDRYRGKVSLEGVVSAVAPEQQAVSLVDAKEFQSCGVTTCAQLALPVQWRGPMLAVGALVRVEGQVRKLRAS